MIDSNVEIRRKYILAGQLSYMNKRIMTLDQEPSL